MSKKSSDIGGIITQKLLGQNEDTIAAIVENLQLGRLDDCMQQYKVLHHNLVSLAHELDNIPTEDSDAYQFIDGFPDEIMRLDPLDDLLPLEEKNLPKLPLIPPCPRCHQLQMSAEQCRLEMKHIEPSHNFSDSERDELFKASQLIMAKMRKKQKDGQIENQPKKKRHYKRWDEDDKYTLEVAMRIFGITNYSRISAVCVDRNESQVRHFIAKLTKSPNYQLPPLVDLLSNPPAGYHPPPLLQPFYKAHAENRLEEALSADSLGKILKHSKKSSKSGNGDNVESLSSNMNKTVDRQGKNNFADLINIATTLDGVDKLLSYIDDLGDQFFSGGGESSTSISDSFSYGHNLEHGYSNRQDSYVPSSSSSRSAHLLYGDNNSYIAHHGQATTSAVHYDTHEVYGRNITDIAIHNSQTSRISLEDTSAFHRQQTQTSAHHYPNHAHLEQQLLPQRHSYLAYGSQQSPLPSSLGQFQTQQPLSNSVQNSNAIPQSLFPFAQSQPQSQPPIHGSPLPVDLRNSHVSLFHPINSAASSSTLISMPSLPGATAFQNQIGDQIPRSSTPSSGSVLQQPESIAQAQSIINPLISQLQMIHGTTSLMEQYEVARLMEQKLNNEACAALQQMARQQSTTKQEKAAILMQYYRLSGSVRTRDGLVPPPNPGIAFQGIPPQHSTAAGRSSSKPHVSTRTNPI